MLVFVCQHPFFRLPFPLENKGKCWYFCPSFLCRFRRHFAGGIIFPLMTRLGTGPRGVKYVIFYPDLSGNAGFFSPAIVRRSGRRFGLRWCPFRTQLLFPERKRDCCSCSCRWLVWWFGLCRFVLWFPCSPPRATFLKFCGWTNPGLRS